MRLPKILDTWVNSITADPSFTPILKLWTSVKCLRDFVIMRCYCKTNLSYTEKGIGARKFKGFFFLNNKNICKMGNKFTHYDFQLLGKHMYMYITIRKLIMQYNKKLTPNALLGKCLRNKYFPLYFTITASIKLVIL